MALTLDFEHPSERAKGPAICLAWGEAPGSDAFHRARAEGPTSCTKLAGLSALSTLVLPPGAAPQAKQLVGLLALCRPDRCKVSTIGLTPPAGIVSASGLENRDVLTVLQLSSR